MITSGAEPFLLPGGSKGVLLIHGFTCSPSEMILLGRGLFILYSYISHCSFFINSSFDNVLYSSRNLL